MQNLANSPLGAYCFYLLLPLKMNPFRENALREGDKPIPTNYAYMGLFSADNPQRLHPLQTFNAVNQAAEIPLHHICFDGYGNIGNPVNGNCLINC